jgi:hypothetical protein
VTDTRAGEGPLTYGRVLRQAWGMFRRHFSRVAIVALILFVPPPLLAIVLDGVRESLEADPRLIRGLGYVIGLLFAGMVRLKRPGFRGDPDDRFQAAAATCWSAQYAASYSAGGM